MFDKNRRIFAADYVAAEWVGKGMLLGKGRQHGRSMCLPLSFLAMPVNPSNGKRPSDLLLLCL